MNIERKPNNPLEPLFRKKPNTAAGAGIGAAVGAVVGALLWGPFGALILGAFGGGVGGYSGAKTDERYNNQ